METASFYEKVEKIKMSVRILILIGTIVVLAGLFAWFVYLPKTDEISKTRNEIANLQQQLRRAQIRAKRLEEFEAEFVKVEAQFNEALKLLPDKKEIPSLLKSIDTLGKSSELEFTLFQPKGEVKKDFYIEIPVSLEVSGNYHNVAVFFDRVGQLERIVNILDVSMKPEKELSTKLLVSCNAVTYMFEGESHEKQAPVKKK
ncbi:MAG: type 4a pilus biogenesis protein PilO [Deltaproteobacteria bacterium]|nr:type 4a pilus biogenesis protein PilO [Deltaproteobacteria bacterium]